MTSEPLPEPVRQLLAERAAARASRDFSHADALRDELAALGWEAIDGPDGSTARPRLTPMASEEAAPGLDAPATLTASVQVVAEAHPEDLARCLRGLAGHPPARLEWELVIVANAPPYDLDAVVADVSLAQPPIVVAVQAPLGWAESRTLGMRHSRGEITILLDTSIEPTGDLVTPLVAAFDDPTVGIAGGWGVRSLDVREFDDAPAGEVDAVEGYCLAIRRAALRAVGGFDRRFRFYRNADLDLSFAVRDAGWRAVRTDPLPVVRHEHRGWTSLPDEERDRLSRRNFYRFLDRWRDRPDLLLANRATEARGR
jgi:cysteinyl-tRNA synthetase